MVKTTSQREPQRAGQCRRLPAILAIALGLAVPAIAFACSVPVFRFALEQWRPDAYQVFLYHDQDLSEADRQLLQRLQNRGSATGDSNVQVQVIDLRSELETADHVRWKEFGEHSLPHMVVNLPKAIAGGEARVGNAPWNKQEVDRLLGSPARSELAQRLIAGHVVWVFLGGGKPPEDDAKLAELELELAGLQETLELPTIEQEDLKDLSVDPEALQIRFSVLQVDRTDPAEKWFVEMLLSSEPDLRDDEWAGQAMVFPVFGRGRSLYALIGNGINTDMIKDAAEFLTGPCQCTVKVENPGVDLLLPVRWDEQIVPTEPTEVALPLVGLGGYQPDPESGLPIITQTGGEAAGNAQPAAEAADNSAADNSAAERSTMELRPAALAQVDAPPERPTLMLWLPWVMVVLLGAIVVLASASFFRRQ